MNKKHLAIGVAVITFLAPTITLVLIWMMNYQSSDVLVSPSPPPNSPLQWSQSSHPNQAYPDIAEDFSGETLEDMASSTIWQPENINITQLDETTEPTSAIPVVPKQPKIPWSQLNQSLLELEQEQAAIMTLLTQKYSYMAEPETKIVEPVAKAIAPNPQIVESKIVTSKKVTTETPIVATTATAVEPEINRLITTAAEAIEIEPEIPEFMVATETPMIATTAEPVTNTLTTAVAKIEPEIPKMVTTETKIAATARPVEPETHTLTTATNPLEFTNLLGKKPRLQSPELSWDTDWFTPLDSSTWLNIGQKILELEQWREKIINSLNTQFSYHDSKANDQ
jgi:hypothetical protein